jgi:single-strand selective monofunctional uracil DNA glycosylase
MGLDAEVRAPPAALRHPKREVRGFASKRREVSGTRLYSLAREHFGGIEAFFRRFWIVNYCPLAFFDEGGANVTPPRLRKDDRERLFAVCDRHLVQVVEILEPDVVIGIGKFAERRAVHAAGSHRRVGGILHPSPASPKANRGWAGQALSELAALGIAPATET